MDIFILHNLAHDRRLRNLVVKYEQANQVAAEAPDRGIPPERNQGDHHPDCGNDPHGWGGC
jgi:hypothetical protein